VPKKRLISIVVMSWLLVGLLSSQTAAAYDEEKKGSSTGNVFVTNLYVWVGDTSRYSEAAIQYRMTLTSNSFVYGRWECRQNIKTTDTWGTGVQANTWTVGFDAPDGAHVVFSEEDDYCAYHLWASTGGFRVNGVVAGTQPVVRFWLKTFNGPNPTAPPGGTPAPGTSSTPTPSPTPPPEPSNTCDNTPGHVPGYLEMHSSIYDNAHMSKTGHSVSNDAHTHVQIACVFPLATGHYYHLTWKLLNRTMDTTIGSASFQVREQSDLGNCGSPTVSLTNSDLTVGNEDVSDPWQVGSVGSCDDHGTPRYYSIDIGTTGHTFNGYGYIFRLGLEETDDEGNPMATPTPSPTPTPEDESPEPFVDSDGDGYSDQVENGAGTDKDDPNSYPGSTPNGSPPPGGGYTFPSFPPSAEDPGGPNLGGNGGYVPPNPRHPNKTGIAACDADDGTYTKPGQAPLQPLNDTSFPGSPNPLDYIPWVGNMIANVPIIIGNAGQWMANTGIDWVVPGDCLPGIVEDHLTDLEGRPPLSLFTEVQSATTGSPGGSLPSIPLPGGGSVTIPAGVLSEGGTVRGILVAFVWLGAALAIGRIIMRTFGVGGAAGDS